MRLDQTLILPKLVPKQVFVFFFFLPSHPCSSYSKANISASTALVVVMIVVLLRIERLDALPVGEGFDALCGLHAVYLRARTRSGF